jgi:hypothetical protein
MTLTLFSGAWGKMIHEKTRSKISHDTVPLRVLSSLLPSPFPQYLNPGVLLRTAMYGKVLVLLMIAFCLIEVMDNKVAPLTFQVFLKGQPFGISVALKGQYNVNSASSRSSARRPRHSKWRHLPSSYTKGHPFRISLA